MHASRNERFLRFANVTLTTSCFDFSYVLYLDKTENVRFCKHGFQCATETSPKNFLPDQRALLFALHSAVYFCTQTYIRALRYIKVFLVPRRQSHVN